MQYAPIIINSPCAILITPTTPKVIAKPIAASSRTDPNDRPKKIVLNILFIWIFFKDLDRAFFASIFI